MTPADLRRLAGQLFSVGFDGTDAPDALLARITDSDVGGVTLFRPNIANPAQVAALVTSLRRAAPPDAPLLVSVDQEGGAVQRLRAPLTEWPDMLSVGAGGDPARTEAVGRALGDELAALGIGWNLAPVLDVHTNPKNPVIGNRAFGRTPQAVATHALAFWSGLRAAGVVGCGKHFPGHGDTRTDSHHELPVVPHDLARLRAIELHPFAAAVRAGMPAIMTAHVLFPAVDPERPATMSPPIIQGLLRGELGFAGVVVSDDLGMKAVAARYSVDEIVVGALLAGVDHFLIRHDARRQAAALDALVTAARKNAVVHARIVESAARVAALKCDARVGLPAPAALLPSLLGTDAHRALSASFARVDATSPELSPVAGD